MAPSSHDRHTARFQVLRWQSAIHNLPPPLIDSAALTLQVALAATVIVGIAGTVLGRWLARGKGVWRDLVDLVVMLPLLLPPTVLGWYLTRVFGRTRPVGAVLEGVGLGVMFSWRGAVLASAVVALPMMTRAARTAFESIDHTLEEAAALDGATGLRRWRLLLLPLAARGLAGGAALAFARAAGEFGATLMLGGNIPGSTQTLSLALYDAFNRGDDAAAGTIALLLVAISAAVMLVTLRSVAGKW